MNSILLQKSQEIQVFNFLETINEQTDTEFNRFADLGIGKKKMQIDEKEKKNDRPEDLELRKDLEIMQQTLQELKRIFLKFLERADPGDQSDQAFQHMLREIKSLYNQIIGSRCIYIWLIRNSYNGNYD